MTHPLLQQAVEALNVLITHHVPSGTPDQRAGFAALAALGEAALQQQPEPVAWMVTSHYEEEQWVYLTTTRPDTSLGVTPLYTAPPALQQQEEPRELLSDARVLHLWDTHVGDPTAELPLTDADKLAFARAVLYASPHPPAANPPAAQVKCLYCTRDMIAGSECRSEEQAQGCEGLADGVNAPDGGQG